MFQSNPAVEPKLPPAANPHFLEKKLEEDCTYVPDILDWDESLEVRYSAPMPSELEVTPYQERIAKRYRRNRLLASFALGASLFSGVHVGYYLNDVRANMAETEEAKPTIRIMSDTPEESDSHKATIFYHGFNMYGASDLVEWLGEGAKQAYDGEQWSIQYNNAPLDAQEIADAVNEKIKERGITSVDVVTYSMGDVPGIENAVNTINTSWVDVESVTVMSGPMDYDGLTDKTKDELAIAKSFAWIPWVEYSTPFRYLAEMYFYKDSIERDPLETIEGINTRFSYGNYTTNAFLASQINSISDSDIGSDIQSIDPTKFQPVINYIKINDGKDTVVDNDYSADKLCESAEKIDLTCNIFEVNSTHGNYWNTVDEYNKVFAQVGEILKPQVEKEKGRYAMYLYNLQHFNDNDPRKPW